MTNIKNGKTAEESISENMLDQVSGGKEDPKASSGKLDDRLFEDLDDSAETKGFVFFKKKKFHHHHH